MKLWIFDEEEKIIKLENDGTLISHQMQVLWHHERGPSFHFETIATTGQWGETNFITG